MKTLTSLTLRLCPVGNDGVKYLVTLLALQWLNLSGTRITDAGLKYVGRLSGLKYLWLDDTAITDKGLSSIQSLASLETLSLRNTSVADAGLLHLVSLSRLTLGMESLSGTAVTKEGLDAYFLRQQSVIRGGDETLTPPVPDEEGEAKGQLLKFFAAMNQWWKICVKVTRQANALPDGSSGRDKLWREEEVALDQVFSEYCANPRTARAEKMAPGMVYYPIDKLVIRSVEKVEQDQVLFNIDKQGDLGSVTRYQFFMRKKKGQWLVDHKRVWKGGWAREPF